MGSAMDEEALVASISQFLKKEDERLSKMNSEMAQLTLERKSLLNDVQELKAMVYQYFNIPIPTHKVAKEVSIMASELSVQHKGTRCEQPAVNENSLCSAHQVFDETPKSANTIEVVQIDESSEDGDEALFEIVGNIKRDEEPSQILVPNEPNSAKESSDLVARHVLEEMPQSTKTLKVDLIDELTKDEFSLVFDFLTWEIFVGFVPRIGQGAKNYCDETLIFDPGGLIVINNLSFLAASGEPSFGHTIDVGDSFKLAIIPQEKSSLCYINEDVTAGTKPPKDFRRKHRTMLLGCLLWFDVELESFAKNVWRILLRKPTAVVHMMPFDPGGEDMLSVARLTNEEHKNLKVFELVARLIKGIIETYQICNPDFKYAEELNPKRFLTSPADGVLNDWHLQSTFV